MKPRTIINTLIILVTALAIGCVPIRTKIGVNPTTGEFTYKSPKNVKCESLVITRDTNGAVTVKIANPTTENDPDVIASKGMADANVANAVGNQVRGGLQDGMNLAAMYFSKGLVHPTPTNAP